MTAINLKDLASQPLPSLVGGGGGGGGGGVHLQSSATAWGIPSTSPAGGGGGDMTAARLDRTWNHMSAAGATASSIIHGSRPAATSVLTGASTATAATAPSSLSIQERLKKQEQETLQSLVQDTAGRTRQRTDNLVESQLQKEWELDKERWRKDFWGPRSSSGATSHPQLLGPGESLTPGGTRSIATAPGGGGGSLGMSAAAPTAWPPHGHQPPSVSNAPLPVALAQSHLSILKRIERFDAETMAAWVQLASQATTPTSNHQQKLAPHELAYRSAWIWMQHLLTCIPQRQHSGGEQQRASPVLQAAAALSHLCLLFQSAISDRHRRAVESNSISSSSAPLYQHDFANQCATFVKLTFGLSPTSSSSTAQPSQQDGAFWPILFCCLRSGHAVAALHVYEQQHAPNSTVLQVLQTLARAQGSSRCLWLAQPQQPGTTNVQQQQVLPHVSESDRRMVADLLQAAQHREPPAGLHEQGVYAFLSGQPLPSGSSLAGLGQIEDYLTGLLWKALLVSTPTGADNTGTVKQLEQVGEFLRDLGPNRFGGPTSGGWLFALPLLLTQQYERALVHLTKAGGLTGLLQATHLAYVLFSVGVPLIDLGASPSSSSLSLGDPNAAAAAAAAGKDGSDLVTSLLLSYAQQLLGHSSLGASVALEYIVRIPDKGQARREVAKLIVTTGELTLLVGGVDGQGKRIKDGSKTIDLHFTDQQIAQILEQAAEMLLRGGDPASAGGPMSSHVQRHKELALMCYLHAGRYADVLQLLNQLLSPPEQPDGRRNFWLSELDSFRQYYLSKRTHVVQVLEQQNQMSLVETSRTLVELNTFFGHLRQNRQEQAWLSQQRLHLLPTSRAEMNAKETAYHQLDPLVKKAFPALLLGVMKLLHAEHTRLKQEHHHYHHVMMASSSISNSTGPVAKERLSQIREQGKLLVTLAGMVGIVGEQLDQLSRLENLLI